MLRRRRRQQEDQARDDEGRGHGSDPQGEVEQLQEEGSVLAPRGEEAAREDCREADRQSIGCKGCHVEGDAVREGDHQVEGEEGGINGNRDEKGIQLGAQEEDCKERSVSGSSL